MPPTPDIGPVAPDCGSLQPIAPNVWAWIGNGTGNAGVVIEVDAKGTVYLDIKQSYACCAESKAASSLVRGGIP